MLSLTQERRPKFPEALQAIANGADSVETLQRVYGKSPSDLEKELRSYVRQTSFLAAVFDVRLEKGAEATAFEPASDLETRLLLAGLLAGQPSKAEESERRLLALQADYPESAEVAEALGDWAWRSKSSAEAVPHFERAAELGGTNPRMYRNLAALSRGTHQRDFQIRMLEKAVQLDPDDLDSRRILGHLYIQDQQWSKGLVQLNKITKVETAEEAYALYHSRAYGYYRLNDLDTAEKLAESARRHADEPRKTAQTELLLQAIARTRDQRAFEAAGASAAGAAPPPPPEVSDDGDKPGLAYNPLPPEEREERVSVERKPSFVGGLTNFECLGDRAVITVESGGAARSFVIADPMGIVILRNGEGAPDVSFTCGPQDGRALEVTYQQEPGGEARVVALDFLDPRP